MSHRPPLEVGQRMGEPDDDPDSPWPPCPPGWPSIFWPGGAMWHLCEERARERGMTPEEWMDGIRRKCGEGDDAS